MIGARLMVAAWMAILVVVEARGPVAGDSPATAPTTKPAWSKTVGAHRSLQIQWDRQSGFMPDIGALTDALSRPERTADIARKFIGLDALPAGALWFGGKMDDHGAVLTINVTLPPEATHAASELAEALVRRVRSDLEQQFDVWRGTQLEMIHAEKDRQMRAVEELAAQIEDRRNKARSMTGRLDVSPDAIRATAAKLEDQRMTLELELAGSSARRKAIEERIAEISARGEKSIKGDEAAAQLEQVVKIREQSLDLIRKQYQAGSGAAMEVSKEEAALAEAKARVALRRSDVAAAAGGGELLAQLNRELTMLSIDVQEKQVRTELIEKQLARLRDVPSLLDSIESDQAALGRARMKLEAIQAQAEDMDRRLSAMRPPMVIVETFRDELDSSELQRRFGVLPGVPGGGSGK
jgi:hypothetical protein